MLDETDNLCRRIARLVRERGLSQEEFSRLANLNRLTIRHIFQGGPRRLHEATVRACAGVLGVSPEELREAPLEKLVPRVRQTDAGAACWRRRFEEATQPELLAWMERHPERAAQLSAEEVDELLSLQGTGGPLTSHGVAHFVERIERKRQLLQKVSAVAGTEYIDLLEQFVQLLYEKVQPYTDRASSGGKRET